MRPLAALLGVCAASLLCYAVAFGFLVHKPLTVDVVAEMMTAKRRYAEAAPSPKLVIFAGSNARMSHRCATIEEELGLPCANLGVGRGIGLDYELDFYKPALRPGDVVYMPLEYDEYLGSKLQMMTGPDSALMFQNDKARLFRYGWERTLRAAFAFDLPYLVSGLAEMGLDAAGFHRRFGLATLTPQGDERGHTLAKAREFRAFIAATRSSVPSAAALATPSDEKTVLRDFLRWAKERGVRVVGGLPTTFADAAVSDDVVAAVRAVYEEEGQSFLALGNCSQYPRSCFYDTAWHLAEPCQIEHSKALAEALRPILAR